MRRLAPCPFKEKNEILDFGRIPAGRYDLNFRPPSAHPTGDIRRRFLRSRANSIEGGTSEIMKNILGERVLGLPGEPRVDVDVPWTDVPRS